MRKLISENNFFGNTCSLISHTHFSAINISAAPPYSKNEFIRRKGAVRILFFSLKPSSGANQKKKKKDMGAGNI